jgi:hypothetical protein
MSAHTEQNLDRLTDQIADAAVMASDLRLDELAFALRDLASASAHVAAVDGEVVS